MMRNNQTSDRGSNPSKRRATPIPVQPPRIPTPMPATNNNNPHSRVVVGGCNKDQLQAQKKQYESQSTSSTKNSTKYLDNDVKTSWINPRLISKIDMEAVISSEYVPPVQRANLYNRNNFQSNQVQHQIHQQQQQHQQQNKRERTAVIQQQQEWETPASTCSGSNRTTSTTSGGKCQQMARQSSIILSVASMPHTDAVLPCKRAERTAAKHVVSMKHATRHKSHYGTPKPVKHSLNCSDKVTINSGKQHSSNFNSSSASNNQHKTLPNVTLPVAYSDSVSVSSYASAAGPVADRASASGVFGLYSESKYTYSVNRLPGNPAQTSAAAAFFARAAQKLNLSASPHRRKRHSSGDEEYTTGGFSGVIQRTPPPVPPALLRRIGVKEITGVGKVKVMLRVSTPTNGSPQEGSATGSFFSLDYF